MIINTTVIVIAAVLLILSIVSPLFNPLFRSTGVEFTRPGNTDSPSNGKLPGISVIVPVHNDADKLDQLLPILLSQQYDGDFQVICVCDKSDDLSEDVASRYKNNTHFYSTFIPDGSHFMSRKKLAITIGVKAARYPWVVLLDAWSKPVSDEWLEAMAEHMRPEYDIIIGYSNFQNTTKGFGRFERLRNFCYLARMANQDSAFMAGGSNLAFRKEMFMKGNGFSGNLELVRGEYDLLVNKYARIGRTFYSACPDICVLDDTPSKLAWRNIHIFAYETRRHLQHRGKFSFVTFFDQFMLHFTLWAQLAALAFSIWQSYWILCAAAVVSMLVSMIERVAIDHKCLKAYHEVISTIALVPYELSMAWHNISMFLRYKFADKSDFTTHKI